MDRISFDFETNEVTIDTEHQHGVQTIPDLAKRKDDIMKAAGLGYFDLSNAVHIFEDFINGNIDETEMMSQLEKEYEDD